MAKEEKQRKIMMSLLSYYTCFKNAPVLIIAYSKEYYMIEEKYLAIIMQVRKLLMNVKI